MIVALTGAAGFVGAATARSLHEAGHEVTALVRPGSAREHIEPYVNRYVEGDHADPAVWESLLDDAGGVVHNSADWLALRGPLADHLRSNLDASLIFLKAASDRAVRRFVFLSSVATMHDISPAWGGVIDEDHPLRPSTLYGAYKAAVEAHLWWAHYELGMATVALRPAAVYGVEPVRLERSIGYRQIRRLLDGGRVAPQEFKGGGKFVHVDDVALACVRALERDGAAGRPFNLADCYARHTLFGELARQELGLPPDRVELDSGPPAKNSFSKEAARAALGVALGRGEQGLRTHVRELLRVMRSK